MRTVVVSFYCSIGFWGILAALLFILFPFENSSQGSPWRRQQLCGKLLPLKRKRGEKDVASPEECKEGRRDSIRPGDEYLVNDGKVVVTLAGPIRLPSDCTVTPYSGDPKTREMLEKISKKDYSPFPKRKEVLKEVLEILDKNTSSSNGVMDKIGSMFKPPEKDASALGDSKLPDDLLDDMLRSSSSDDRFIQMLDDLGNEEDEQYSVGPREARVTEMLRPTGKAVIPVNVSRMDEWMDHTDFSAGLFHESNGSWNMDKMMTWNGTSLEGIAQEILCEEDLDRVIARRKKEFEDARFEDRTDWGYVNVENGVTKGRIKEAAEVVNLSGLNITTLKKEMFQNLRNLKVLQLRGNKIKHLPEGIFASMTGLQYVDLSDNLLSDIPSAFEEKSLSSNLFHLNLNKNNISVLNLGRLRNLKNLTELSLDNNEILRLPPLVSSSMPRLESFSLKGNQIRFLPSNFLHGLRRLVSINLSENKIGKIPKDLFKTCSKLSDIKIESNLIAALPAMLLRPTPAISFLKLQRNAIKTIPEGFLNGQTRMRVLKLGYNNISFVPRDLLKDCVNLGSFALRNTPIKILPKELFSSCKVLKRLELDGNSNLEMIERGTFYPLQSVVFINMTGHGLRSIPQDMFSRCQTLMDLYMGGKYLNALPSGSTSYLPNLKHVDLPTYYTSRPPLSLHTERDGVSGARAFCSEGAKGTEYPFRSTPNANQVTEDEGSTLRSKAQHMHIHTEIDSDYIAAAKPGTIVGHVRPDREVEAAMRRRNARFQGTRGLGGRGRGRGFVRRGGSSQGRGRSLEETSSNAHRYPRSNRGGGRIFTTTGRRGRLSNRRGTHD
mmetsp:Transcript_12021/g.19630  ORF Transcript_12021/g.19630 Transcript_12021/m.19630 type:complete len:833 (-) Transcript_12021:84-2582(-)